MWVKNNKSWILSHWSWFWHHFSWEEVFCQNQESNGSQGCPRWSQKSYSEISPLQRWKDAFSHWFLGYYAPRNVSSEKIYEISLQNKGLRKALKCAVTKSKFSALFHLECNNKGCVIIPKSMKSVFNLKFQCFSFAEFQTKIKIKAVTILEKSCKTPKVLCKNY